MRNHSPGVEEIPGDVFAQFESWQIKSNFYD